MRLTKQHDHSHIAAKCLRAACSQLLVLLTGGWHINFVSATDRKDLPCETASAIIMQAQNTCIDMVTHLSIAIAGHTMQWQIFIQYVCAVLMPSLVFIADSTLQTIMKLRCSMYTQSFCINGSSVVFHLCSSINIVHL